MSWFKKLSQAFLVLLLVGCATCPWPEGSVQPIINEGFSVEHENCYGLEASTWLITFEVYEKDCDLLKTNLIAYWNGCKYILMQVMPQPDGTSVLERVGEFKSIEQIQEWIKITNGWIGKRSGGAGAVKGVHPPGRAVE